MVHRQQKTRRGDAGTVPIGTGVRAVNLPTRLARDQVTIIAASLFITLKRKYYLWSGGSLS
jgi:hypothetical protein